MLPCTRPIATVLTTTLTNRLRSYPVAVVQLSNMAAEAPNVKVQKHPRVLSVDSMNPNVKKMEYAVRGPLVIRAGEIERELKKGFKKDFDKVIRANIGDCHAVGQQPLTFIRQVAACCAYPPLMEGDMMPSDVKDRAHRVLSGCRGSSIGSYTDSCGIDSIREDIAAYIQRRDGGIPSNSADVFLCSGASDGIKSILKLLMTDNPEKQAGVMIPIPQYPLYSATVTEYNAFPIPYYLNEANHWQLDIDDMRKAIKEARKKCEPRGIVIINPGNPTGQVLSKENIMDVVKFAKEENLVILADEVYQHNVYAEGSQFHSMKKISQEMGGDYSKMEIASFMSVSKGFMGECGYRGGYCEVINLDPQVKVNLFKFLSAKLCPNVAGQAVMEVIVNPPKLGEPSYELFEKEKQQVLGDLAIKAKHATAILNSIEGITCNEVMGAMYAFPQIYLPQGAIDKAKERGMQPDAFYCFELLETTGICVVPGSGFGQQPGTYHFRMTILPPVKELELLLAKFQQFHVKFLEQYDKK